MKTKTDFQIAKESYLEQVKEARDEITLTWYVPGRSKREYDKKVEEIYEVLNEFKVKFTDLGVDRDGKVTLVVQSMRDVETVENEMGFDPEFVDFREGEIEIAEGAQKKKRQVNERRGSGPLSAKQVSKRADTLSKNISEFENILKQSKPEGISSKDYNKAISDMRSSYIDLMDAIDKGEGMMK